jgi:hypothetical protein
MSHLSEERIDALVRDMSAILAKKWTGKIERVPGSALQPTALPERLVKNFDALEWRADFAKSRENVMGDAKHKTKK